MSHEISPLPWSCYESTLSKNGNLWFVIADSERRVAETYSEAHARFIVTACNAHHDLLAALKNALVELEVNGDSIGAVVDVLESEGRAAIAKAEGR